MKFWQSVRNKFATTEWKIVSSMYQIFIGDTFCNIIYSLFIITSLKKSSGEDENKQQLSPANYIWPLLAVQFAA